LRDSPETVKFLYLGIWESDDRALKGSLAKISGNPRKSRGWFNQFIIDT
jgi:hypothetical protein